MVVIRFPETALTGITHERTAAPSIGTGQAPHWATPQPYFVPVRPTCSRMTQSSGVFGSASTSYVWPFMDKRAMVVSSFVVGKRESLIAVLDDAPWTATAPNI